MNQKIRVSILEDAEHFIRIKDNLPLNTNSEDTQQGGFLLGTDLETYQFYIQHGQCLTAISSDEIIGFGILLPNHLVKQSEVWEKRNSANWSIDLATIENSNIAYIEQMAFLRKNQKLVLILAYNLIHSAFEHGAEYILTTTVRKPVLNLAAIPLIRAAGGKKVGNIDEVYPQVGQINSDLYLMEKDVFYQTIKKRVIYDFLIANTLKK